jgi:hypothetical protein
MGKVSKQIEIRQPRNRIAPKWIATALQNLAIQETAQKRVYIAQHLIQLYKQDNALRLRIVFVAILNTALLGKPVLSTYSSVTWFCGFWCVLCLYLFCITA